MISTFQKKLVPPSLQSPKWPKHEGKKSMSVLIGIICPEAIVLAADSHITETCNGTYDSVDKIGVVDFWVDEVLVAQAGSWSITNRIVEKMREKAKGVRITSASVVLKIAEDSIRETKNPMDEDQTKFFYANPPALMLAFYVGDKPNLHKVYLDGSGITSPKAGHYAAVGIGEFLATYLLGEYAVPKSHSDLAIATSVFAIKKVKDITKYCGGDTTVKRIFPIPQFIDLDKHHIGKADQIPQNFINLTEKRLINFDLKTKKSRDKQVFAILKKIGAKLWEQHRKRIKAELKVEEAEEQQRGKETEEMLKKFHSNT